MDYRILIATGYRSGARVRSRKSGFVYVLGDVLEYSASIYFPGMTKCEFGIYTSELGTNFILIS